MSYLSYHIPKIKRISNNIPNIVKNLENVLKKNKIKPSYIGKGYYIQYYLLCLMTHF